jgi:Flp pilus assembly protein TadG
MSLHSSLRQQRRGTIAPLAAILSVFIVAMVAFSVDTSWIVLTRSELQNAADSAALAGAGQLMDGYVLYNLPNQTASTKVTIINSAISSAQVAAKQYAGYNAAGGVTNLVLNDADIQVGFLDQSGKFTASNSNGPYPNTVKVLMRRDAKANQSLRLFFAPVLGVTTMDVNAPSSATCYAGTINSFNPATGQNVNLLPVTYDVNAWSNFIKTGKAPDGSTNTAGNGSPQVQIYPSVKDVGNFGLISLNDAHVGASTVTQWINQGASPTDIQSLINNNLIPLANHPSNTWTWNAENGFKATDVTAMNAYTGTTYLIPLFQPVSTGPIPPYQAGVGNGSWYFYDVVQFVAVTIMPVNDVNRTIVVQPGAYIDPSAVFTPGTVVPMGTSSFSTTFTAPKLSS